MFAPEAFRKQMYCIEESTCDIVRTFRHPYSDSAPGELLPLALPLLRPCVCDSGNSIELEELHRAFVVQLTRCLTAIQARSQGGNAPFPNSESNTKIFQVNQAFDVQAKEIRQCKSTKLLK